jgi:hypothetical protein
MNYAQLTAAIKGYAENDFPDTVGSFTSATQIATFVEETEQRVFNAVQLLDLRKNVLGSVTANNKYLGTPLDWLANFSLAVIDPVNGRVRVSVRQRRELYTPVVSFAYRYW